MSAGAVRHGALTLSARPFFLPPFSSQSMFCTCVFKGKNNQISFINECKIKNHSVWIIKSVLENAKPSRRDHGAAEPARILLDSLFSQAQKLEEHIGRESSLPQVIELGFNLGKLESDLQAALEALKKKEEDLQDTERKVLMEYSELNQIKSEFEEREAKILAASSEQEKLEEELRQANIKLLSQAREIEGLKLQLGEHMQEISDVQTALSLKEDEIIEMKNELMKKTEHMACAEAELRSKALQLSEANEIVKRQEHDVQELQKVIQDREEELEVSMKLQKVEEDKRKIAEANLERHTMDWLLAQRELKKMSEELTNQSEGAMEDFTRVKKLLSDVRTELVSSQRDMASSRQKMEEQDYLLEKQLTELNEQKKSLMSYLTRLKDAQTEVESERVNLRIAEAQNEALERDLSAERVLVENLQGALRRERASLEQAVEENARLQGELKQKNNEFREAQSLLQVKESELVKARLEIQRLKGEQASFLLLLEDKELELFGAKKMLEEVNKEVSALRLLMNNKEDQLIQATTILKEKDEHMQAIQHELANTKLQVHEAESAVKEIVKFTNKLVISVKDEHNQAFSPSDDMDENSSHCQSQKPGDKFIWQKKRLETHLKVATESLQTKSEEVLAAQRALSIKEEELKIVQGKLHEKEKQLQKMRKEFAHTQDDLMKLRALTEETIDERSRGDAVLERLQLDAAQLEVEAATSTLYRLAEMSRELLGMASSTLEADPFSCVFLENAAENKPGVAFDEIREEVTRLSDLTEQLVNEAGILGDEKFKVVKTSSS